MLFRSTRRPGKSSSDRQRVRVARRAPCLQRASRSRSHRVTRAHNHASCEGVVFASGDACANDVRPASIPRPPDRTCGAGDRSRTGGGQCGALTCHLDTPAWRSRKETWCRESPWAPKARPETLTPHPLESNQNLPGFNRARRPTTQEWDTSAARMFEAHAQRRSSSSSSIVRELPLCARRTSGIDAFASFASAPIAA